jgi:hypothetical protein
MTTAAPKDRIICGDTPLNDYLWGLSNTEKSRLFAQAGFLILFGTMHRIEQAQRMLDYCRSS